MKFLSQVHLGKVNTKEELESRTLLRDLYFYTDNPDPSHSTINMQKKYTRENVAYISIYQQ